MATQCLCGAGEALARRLLKPDAPSNTRYRLWISVCSRVNLRSDPCHETL